MLPAQREALVAAMENHQQAEGGGVSWWIYKPASASRGRGISLMASPDDIEAANRQVRRAVVVGVVVVIGVVVSRELLVAALPVACGCCGLSGRSQHGFIFSEPIGTNRNQSEPIETQIG